LNDAGDLATQLEEAVSDLSSTIGDIRVTDGFREVLSETQLDKVHCAAIKVSASVMEYLAEAIVYLSKNRLSMSRNYFLI
jgi:ASC-1-like (ASCH) protein